MRVVIETRENAEFNPRTDLPDERYEAYVVDGPDYIYGVTAYGEDANDAFGQLRDDLTFVHPVLDPRISGIAVYWVHNPN